MKTTMTDDQIRRFAQWQDGLTLDPESFPEALRAALLRRICAWCGERIPVGHAFDARAGDLKACGPTCCDRINEAHGV